MFSETNQEKREKTQITKIINEKEMSLLTLQVKGLQGFCEEQYASKLKQANSQKDKASKWTLGGTENLDRLNNRRD